MKKFAFYIWPLSLVMVLIFTSGCSCGANLPVRYPTIQLPELEPGMSSSIIIDDIIEVPANELWHKTVEIPDTVENVTIAGWFVASGGARNDIKALFLDDIGFHNWRNFSEVKNQPYQSEKISVDNFTAEINNPGKYHLVFSNWFSEFSTKKVIAKVYLYWSVKPVTYKITADNTVLNAKGVVLNADDFKIPASANVTFEFTGGGGLPDFKVSQDVEDNGKKDINVSPNITGPKLWFIAPSYTDNNTYSFSYNCTRAMKGSFRVIAAAPSEEELTFEITANNTVINSDGIVLEANDFQIPASANVTFEFTGGGDIPDFKVSQAEETSINANITGLKLWFIAPSYTDNNTYDFSFNCTLIIEGSFRVIAAAPSIGRGLTVSSSIANAPPYIDEKNTVDQIKKDDPTSENFTIEAIDPDDDELTYYAFNIPVVPDNWEPTNGELHGAWHPIAIMNASTGEFGWNNTAVAKLKEHLKEIPEKGKCYEEEYWIHFEVSDGILFDQWEWKLVLKVCN